jgi:endonuclease YncB( thermonuclease family)
VSKPTQIPVFRAVIPPEGAGHDADTIDVWLDQWFGDWKHEASIRLEGVNATEILTPGPQGEEQRDFVHAMLPSGTRLLLRTKVTSKDLPVQSFQRYVGELWLRDGALVYPGSPGEVSINQWLVWANVVASWDGKSKPIPVPSGPIREEAWEWLRQNRPGFDRLWTL